MSYGDVLDRRNQEKNGEPVGYDCPDWHDGIKVVDIDDLFPAADGSPGQYEAAQIAFEDYQRQVDAARERRLREMSRWGVGEDGRMIYRSDEEQQAELSRLTSTLPTKGS
jgi:hypothetical protein